MTAINENVATSTKLGDDGASVSSTGKCKSGRYVNYSPELWAQIGRYAVEHGIMMQLGTSNK